VSKLQILITQYNETEDIVKPLLDSIENQKNIDLSKDIEVFIGNDGSDVKLSEEFLKKYSYPIRYYSLEHSDLPGCRQKLQNLATADYIMFCDADDMFNSNVAISMILQTAQSGCDFIVCDFLAEVQTKDGQTIYSEYTNDSVFVHGKVYRRQFLVDNCIEWHPELKYNQDSAFNALCRILSKDTKIIKTPLYIWRDNPNSKTRIDKQIHTIKAWPYMIGSFDAFVNDLSLRGFGSYARYYAMYCLYLTYFTCITGRWSGQECIEYKENVYRRLVKFYRDHKLLLLYMTDEKQIEQIKEITRKLAEAKGKLIETKPIETWMQSILNLY